MSVAEQSVPQARDENLVIQPLDEETLVYDLTRHRAHCLNRTAALIWRACDGKRTVSEIARSVGEELQRPVDEGTVLYALGQLDKLHLLKESVARPTPAPWAGVSGMSRRDFIRKAGIAAAVAVPVITSLVAPTKAQAVSCLPTGAACSIGAQCCSGLCIAGICA